MIIRKHPMHIFRPKADPPLAEKKQTGILPEFSNCPKLVNLENLPKEDFLSLCSGFRCPILRTELGRKNSKNGQNMQRSGLKDMLRIRQSLKLRKKSPLKLRN